MRVALGHKARVGKDTFADRFVEAHEGALRVRIAEPVYTIAEFVQTICPLPDGPQKEPALLQGVGEMVRRVRGENVWIDTAIRKIREGGNRPIVVTDMRYKNEMRALKAEGFYTVKIVRDGRPIDRDPGHSSEVDLDGEEFDYVILNNGSLEDYHSTIDSVVADIRRRGNFA